MNKQVILPADNIVGLKIDAVEKHYNAKFLIETCVKQFKTGWANFPVQLYWQENPPHLGFSHYFALFIRGDGVVITSGQSAVDEPISGVIDNGMFYHSRYRHDMRRLPNGSFIDGGRDYVRLVGNGPFEHAKVKFDGPNLVYVE